VREKLTTPKRELIVQRARELWHIDRARSGDPAFDIEPELSELRESGYLSAAQSELMRNPDAQNTEWLKLESQNVEGSEFEFNIAESRQTTSFISGARGTGKSDIAMYVVDKQIEHRIICVVFDSSMDWLKRSGIKQYQTLTVPYIDRVPEQNTIFDMSLLTPNQQQQAVESFCQKLFQHQIETQCRSRFYLVFEEAQIFCPLNSLRSKTTQNTMRILTVGRNVNISVCAISQFPALIDKELIKHSGQIWIGYTSEPNTLNYWRGMIGKKSEKLKELKNGQFVYYCRNKISLSEIEPYENFTEKQRIVISEPQPIEPITSNQSAGIALLKLGVVAVFAVITALGALR
jgi:hypothetical protein